MLTRADLQQVFGLLDHINEVSNTELRRGPQERVAAATIRALVREAEALLKDEWTRLIHAEAKPLVPTPVAHVEQK